MRLHQLLPWTPVEYRPAKKQDKPSASKVAVQGLGMTEAQVQPVQPRDDPRQGDDPPEGRLDITI
jgi:hypothetical protein